MQVSEFLFHGFAIQTGAGYYYFLSVMYGVSWVKNQSGDEKDRLGRKGYHGGCGGTFMDLAGKSTNVVVF